MSDDNQASEKENSSDEEEEGRPKMPTMDVNFDGYCKALNIVPVRGSVSKNVHEHMVRWVIENPAYDSAKLQYAKRGAKIGVLSHQIVYHENAKRMTNVCPFAHPFILMPYGKQRMSPINGGQYQPHESVSGGGV
mmetsp:Transcript_18618/g.36822  ORF Transcript_18618/g.36822 Transcript_18618/m.36822 type:complete len:135 (+) Transcript_18618:1177-1581(+)